MPPPKQRVLRERAGSARRPPGNSGRRRAWPRRLQPFGDTTIFSFRRAANKIWGLSRAFPWRRVRSRIVRSVARENRPQNRPRRAPATICLPAACPIRVVGPGPYGVSRACAQNTTSYESFYSAALHFFLSAPSRWRASENCSVIDLNWAELGPLGPFREATINACVALHHELGPGLEKVDPGGEA